LLRGLKETFMPREPISPARELLRDQAALDENSALASSANVRSQGNELLLTGVGGINAVAVKELADLPTPSGGDITLVEDTLYYILGEIDIGVNRIIVGINTPIVGRQPRIDSIIGNNATELVSFNQSSGPGLLVQGLTLTQSGAGHSIHVDAGPAMNCIVQDVIIDGEIHVDDCGAFRMESFLINFGSTVIFNGTVGALLVKLGGFVGASGVTSLDFTATAAMGTILVTESQFITTGGSTGIMLDPSATLSKGELSNTVFTGAGTFVDGFTKGSDAWGFASNTGLGNSRDRGVAKWAGAATTVDLPGAAAWRTIADGGVTISYGDGANEKWAITDADTGQLTYSGFQSKGFIVAASVTFTRSSGASIEVEFAVADGGVIDTSSIVSALATNVAQTITIPLTIVDLGPADYCGLRVRNVDVTNPANDIDVTAAVLTIIG
jgi:hypothetical protein